MNRLAIILTLVLALSCQQGRSPGYEDSGTGTLQTEIEVTATAADSLFFNEVMQKLINLAELSTGTGGLVAEAGLAFPGTPYLAHTLEAVGEEHLVVNLQGVDCTTFVEYAAAMALCVAEGNTGFGDFARQLAKLRYRGGVIDGYPSRLHYFTDWLKDNEGKGYIDIISDRIGDRELDTETGFMTSNPGSYRQLGENPEFLDKMAQVEKEISTYRMNYISKEIIDEKSGLIQDGDIIAFVSAIGGLDVSHTGLAVFRDGRLHLLHASLRTGEVEITPLPLSVYLQDSRNVPGILVARVTTDR